MDYYYVTGPSRGIGRALAERLLERAEALVIGVGRSRTISHPRYSHLTLDFKDSQAVAQFAFPAHPDAGRIVLVNNAGALTVKPIGQMDTQRIIDDYLVNLVAPTLLMNSFIGAYWKQQADRQIINISSGAGQRPTDGWAVYCATKAGLDMLSRAVDLEQQVAQRGIRVLSIAPGVADTDMQGQIRATAPEDFSRVQEFVQFKATGGLASPELVAEKLCRVLDDASLTPDVLFSLRSLPDAH